MRRYLLLGSLFVLSVLPVVSQAAVTPDAPANFITTWNTENSGSTGSTQIRIPGSGSGYSYEIYWEDTASSSVNGTTSVITANSYTLTFPAPGIYEVQIAGAFPRIYFNNGGDRRKLLTVEQWGTGAWTSMYRAFYGAENLRVPATDAPNLSGVTTLNDMFSSAFAFNDPIDHWDVSTITEFAHTFRSSAFNQPLDSWDVSGATRFNDMFNGSDFNQPLNSWDMSSAQYINAMFAYTPFNQPLNNWDVSNVRDLRWVFQSTTAFNQDISSWDVSKATTMDCMFCEAQAFNQNVNTWNTASVTDMSRVFRTAVAFNQDLSNWDVTAANWLNDMLTGTALSAAHQDSILNSWSNQSVRSNVSFNLGVKAYTAVGASAIQTLRDTYNWNITEQYRAEYSPSSRGVLEGSASQFPFNPGGTTAPVTVTAKGRCSFTQWSDGRTDNPRQDTLTDNLWVAAQFSCPSSGTSAATQAKKTAQYGNDDQSELITKKFLPNSTPGTLAESLEQVKELPGSFNDLDPIKDREVIVELIAVLLQLIEALSLLLMGMEGE